MMKFIKIFKTTDVRELDKYTIENECITSIDLMKKASSAFVQKLLNFFPNGGTFNVLAGSGNNGGDGYAVALLLQQMGMKVTVYGIHEDEGLSPDCAVYRKRYTRMKGRCVDVKCLEDFQVREHGVFIDAMLGAGLNRPVTGLLAEVIHRVNDCSDPVVAIDIPSGLMGEDNGKNDGAIIRADYTFTFQFPKLAFMFPENAAYVGHWEVLDIGLHPVILQEYPADCYYLTEESVASCLLMPEKFSHKGSLGHTLLVAGSYSMSGAAVLSAKGALHSGTGLLTMHVPRKLKEMMALSVPEVLINEDSDDFCFSEISDLSRFQAIGVGSGMGTSTVTLEGMRRLLTAWDGKMVLDADALNLMAAHPDLLKLLPSGAILTPHPKEFERLAGKSANDFDRLNKLSKFARLYNVYVVLKGAHTTIATPEGACFFNSTGNPGMSKGGAGDVLMGIIAALLASGHTPLHAAIVGVYVHGLAGDFAMNELGMRGMSAGDIVDKLGVAWKKMETCRIVQRL